MIEERELNPPWAAQMLRRTWDRLAAVYGENLLPVSSREKELGCGHYGCVFNTRAKDTVFKLTSDESEAAFVASMLKEPHLWDGSDSPLAGLIRYKGIRQILYEKRSGRNIFAIWREPATCVGEDAILDCAGYTTELDLLTDTLRHLKFIGNTTKEITKEIAKKVAYSTGPGTGVWSWEGAKKLFEIIGKAYAEMTTLLQNENVAKVYERTSYLINRERSLYKRLVYAFILINLNLDFSTTSFETSLDKTRFLLAQPILNTFSFLFHEKKIFLADVHSDNIGLTDRLAGDQRIVITDPGHALALAPKALEQEILTV
jgi:hypothetical protein